MIRTYIITKTDPVCPPIGRGSLQFGQFGELTELQAILVPTNLYNKGDPSVPLTWQTFTARFWTAPDSQALYHSSRSMCNLSDHPREDTTDLKLSAWEKRLKRKRNKHQKIKPSSSVLATLETQMGLLKTVSGGLYYGEMSMKRHWEHCPRVWALTIPSSSLIYKAHLFSCFSLIEP